MQIYRFIPMLMQIYTPDIENKMKSAVFSLGIQPLKCYLVDTDENKKQMFENVIRILALMFIPGFPRLICWLLRITSGFNYAQFR